MILLDSMFELPSLKGVEEVVISPEVIEGNAKPLRIYAERLDKSSSERHGSPVKTKANVPAIFWISENLSAAR